MHMPTLTANNNPILVDRGETEGITVIFYTKKREEELWEMTNGGSWSRISISERVGGGEELELKGSYAITLRPGDIYEVAVFHEKHGPFSPNPTMLTTLPVFCLWKKSERTLIVHQSGSTGGTWHSHRVNTDGPTHIVTIGVSRDRPSVDAKGIPRLKSPDGAPTAPLTVTDDHRVEIRPLYAGHRYYFVVVVADAAGNWDVLQDEFTTLRRKLTVEFPTIHIYNDGDPLTVGEGEFWFEVSKGPYARPEGDKRIVIQEFHLPTQDIDDWSETDRPYPVGFAHVGVLEVAQPGFEDVWVYSYATEHDGADFTDELAGSGVETIGPEGEKGLPSPILLPFPTGRLVETVTNSSFIMDCPAYTPDDDFHYGVEVRWSVEYAA